MEACKKPENQLKHGQQNSQCKPYIQIKTLVSYLYRANSTCWLMLWDAVKSLCWHFFLNECLLTDENDNRTTEQQKKT